MQGIAAFSLFEACVSARFALRAESVLLGC